MKVDAERIENCQAVLTIEVEQERVGEALRQASRRISKRTTIPGFRAGKAPYHLVERTVGKERLFDEALEELGPQVYQEALAQSDLQPIGQAQLEVVEREPLVLKMTVPLEPEVDLRDYRLLRVEGKEVKVEEEEVEKVLTALREDHGEWTPVERPVKDGDLLTLDIEGTSGGQRLIEVKEGEYVEKVGSGLPIPGFPEMIEGMKSGEEKDLSLVCPADHPNEELAGKKIDFLVRLHGVKEKILPPLDDEFAKMVGDFESLEKLREQIKSLLQTQGETKERERVANEMLAQMTEKAKIEYPPFLLQRELDSLREDYSQALAQQGFTLDRYLQITKQSEEEFTKELRPRAEERLKRSLILRRFMEEEGVSVQEEEVEEEMEEIAGSYGDQAQAVKQALLSPEPQRALRSRLFTRKALERLVEIATAPPEPEKEGGKFKVLTLEDVKEERKEKDHE